MVNGLLLDTNVVSALRRLERQTPAFQQWVAHCNEDVFLVSALTWMELAAGVHKLEQHDPEQAKLVRAWVDVVRNDPAFRTIPFGDAEATASAPLWLLRPRGTVDTLIAGTALAHDLTLVTRNTGDYEDIPSLQLINPWL